MKIEDLKDDEFDAWIKKKMESEEESFDPIAFDRFKQKMPKQGLHYKQIGKYTASIIVIALIAWLYWPKNSTIMEQSVLLKTDNNFDDKAVDQKITQKVLTDDNSEPKSYKPLDHPTTTSIIEKKDQLPNKLPNQILVAEISKKQSDALLTRKNLNKKIIENSVFATTINQGSNFDKSISKTNNNEIFKTEKSTSVFDEQSKKKNEISPIVIENKETTLEVNKPEIFGLESKNIFLSQLSTQKIKGTRAFESNTITSKISSEQLSVKRATGNIFKPGLYLSAGLSPDLSLVFGNKIKGIGRNTSLQLEYRFGDRLSISGGYIKAVKKYNASPEQYTWIWRQPNTPLKQISATCSMIDIPVNLRYDFTTNKDIRFFGTVGSTSYQMVNEKYVYNYENNEDPTIKWRKWEGKSGGYPLSVLNFSVGYEHLIDKNLSFTVEPFAKMPLNKVGFGKVNLTSFGVFVSAKTRLFRTNH